MLKIIFFLRIVLAPIFLLFIMDCIYIYMYFYNKPDVLSYASRPIIPLSVMLATFGIVFFIIHIEKSIKNKVIIMNVPDRKIIEIGSYTLIIATIVAMIMKASAMITLITFANCLGLFIYFYLTEMSEAYKSEFVDKFKLVFIDIKYKKWFLFFHKSMFSLNVKFNKDGVYLSNKYIKKENIPYYEAMFNKKITDLSSDDLKIIEMYEI